MYMQIVLIIHILYNKGIKKIYNKIFFFITSLHNSHTSIYFIP